MSSDYTLFESCYLTFGLLVALYLSWRRFDEPSFRDSEKMMLPTADNPLRYLFLGSTYHKARVTYLGLCIILYFVLVVYGRSNIAAALSPAKPPPGAPEAIFPVHWWALVVVFVLASLMPGSNNKWIAFLDARLRRSVHSFFLVPEGIVRTVDILEDATYDPPASVIGAVHKSIWAPLRENPRHTKDALEYKWARATMIFELLKQRGSEQNPLKGELFKPFDKDFEDIRFKYRLILSEIDEFCKDRAEERLRGGNVSPSKTREEDLLNSVNYLLRRMYAYISWGIRQQAKTEEEVDLILKGLGFHIRTISSRDLLNVVVPATVLVGIITFSFWIAHDAISMNYSKLLVARSAMGATAACLMYGFAVFVAVKWRSIQIKRNIWDPSSPRSFVPIAALAGLASWGTIVAFTVFWNPVETLRWLASIWILAKDSISGISDWGFLPKKIATAVPWSITGATAAALLAWQLGGDARRMTPRDRLQDSLVLGVGLGLAAAVAQAIQNYFVSYFGEPSLDLVDFITQAGVAGLAGIACGIVIGFTVPQACRSNIVAPPQTGMAHDLEILLADAKTVFGNCDAAQNWAFSPRTELGGVSPAEAIQYETKFYRVWSILGIEPPRPEPNLEVLPFGMAS